MPITAKQRREMPPEDFGDPKNRLFPVRNQSDMDSAAHLMGKAKDPEAVKRRLMRIAKRKGLNTPEAWKEGDASSKMSALVKSFSAEGLSYNQRRDLLCLALGDAFEGEYWLDDIYDTYIVACEWDMSGMEYNTISYAINADYSVDFGTPQAVQPETVYHPVADPDDDDTADMTGKPQTREPILLSDLSSFASRIDGSFRVYDNANLFKLGDYPDKDFTFNAFDAECAVGSFATAAEPFQPVNIHHVEGLEAMFKDDNLGEVRDLWIDGEWVKGEVAIPLWLDNLLSDDGKQVSAEWTTADKRFVGLALTPNPRVTGAQLMSAFSAAKTTTTATTTTTTTGRTPATPADPNLSRKRNNKEGGKERNAMDWKKFTESLKALFTGAGIKIDDGETPVAPEDKEKAELAAFKASMVSAKREEVLTFAVKALGEGDQLNTVKNTIASTQDIPTLDALKATFEVVAKANFSGNTPNWKPGQRQTMTTEFSGGSPTVEFALNSDQDKARFAKLLAHTPQGEKTLSRMKQEGRI